MDILIKNMEMPKSCSACKCVQRYRYSDECEHLRKPIARNGRLKDCPLVELPPHGELIDRSHLKAVSYEIMAKNDSTKKNISAQTKIQVAILVIVSLSLLVRIAIWIIG